MTPHELPDDHREWPSDPFAILGVERGADDTAIRRAYTGLIRKFKPEHHPDQFCRIREAYDTCREQATWFRPVSVPPPTAEVGEEPSSLPRWSAPIVVEQPPSEADRLWAEATAGNLDAAYRGLAELAAQGDDADVSLRLYWLLALAPNLDRDRTRHHWLFAALAHSRLDHAALELYRRELEADPETGLNEPYRKLLAIDARWPQLVHAAQMRIAAAGRAGRLWIIESDLTAVKERVGLDGDADWLNLLAAALDWASWDESNLVAAFCLDELPALQHLEMHHGYQFDRIDQARYWGGLATAANQPNLVEFFHLHGQLWAAPGVVDRADLTRGLAALAAQPYRALGWLDALFAARGPNLGILAVRMLGRHCDDLDPAHSADRLRGYVRRVPGVRKERWDVLRKRLLDVLIAQRIHPEELAAACAADPESRFREVSEAISGDLSLQLAWMAACLCPVGASS